MHKCKVCSSVGFLPSITGSGCEFCDGSIGGNAPDTTIPLIRALQIHSRAIAAHCECLAMNAENMWAAILNENPKFLQKDYKALMRKWELISEDGEPSI
jgi:hypothetical protein